MTTSPLHSPRVKSWAMRQKHKFTWAGTENQQQLVEELIDAVRRDDMDGVTALLRRNANPDKKSLKKTDGFCPDTPLSVAAANGNVKIVKLLVAHGADVNKRMHPPLCSAGSAAMVRALVSLGAKVNPSDSWFQPLHTAAVGNNLEVVQELLDCGADANAKDGFGSTALHDASAECNASADISKILIAAGANPRATDKYNRTPLHVLKNLADGDGVNVYKAAAVLLEAGADPNAKDNDCSTPLHHIIERHTMAMNPAIELLVSAGADLSAISNEAPYGTPSGTPLEIAAGNRFEALDVLIRLGADQLPGAKDNPLIWRVLTRDTLSNEFLQRDVCASVRLLLSRGFSLPSAEQLSSVGSDSDNKFRSTLLTAIQGWVDERNAKVDKLTIIPDEVFDRGSDDVRAYFKAVSVNRNKILYRKKLCVVGPSGWGKTSFIKSLTTLKSTLEDIDVRTMGIDLFSWEFSLTEEASTSSEAKSLRYQVSLWDFAGQDEYQSAHSLFYSKRTTYLLCVNLKAYVDALTAARHESGEFNYTSAMDRFVEQHIYHWIRGICAHVPESEFVFVGTKADLVGHDASTIRAISSDLIARIQRYENQIVRRLKRQLSVSERAAKSKSNGQDADAVINDEVASLKQLIQSRPRFLSSEVHVMSSADLHGLEDMRAVLQRLIVESNTSFQMPAVYSEVGDYLQSTFTSADADQLKVKFAEFQRLGGERLIGYQLQFEILNLMINKRNMGRTVSSQIHDAFVSIENLKQEIASKSKFAALTESDITAILHVLHCLGDVLWFDETSQSLSTIVFINPALVIDFIRQVVNHTLGDETSAMRVRLTDRTEKLLAAVRDEGRIAHELFERLDLWSEIDDPQLMLQMKELLFHFKLAYPTNGRGLEWNSDLTVPIYWKKRQSDQQETLYQPDLKVLTEHTCWEYDFKMLMPEGLFEKFGVQSYSSSFSSRRVFSSDSFDTISSDPCEYQVRVAKKQQPVGGNDFSTSTLSISVWAASRELLWHQLFLFVMNMEKLLDTYPGLWVARSVVASDGKSFDLQELLVEYHESHAVEARTGFSGGRSSALTTLLPTDMDWYTQRKWRVPVDQLMPGLKGGTETDRQAAACLQGISELKGIIVSGNSSIIARVDESKLAVMTNTAAAGNRANYPALWTLEYQKDGPMLTSKFALRIRSHLSGKCFHDPIEITVPNDFFGKFGIGIKYGLSLFASVVPSMFGQGVIEAVIGVCNGQLDRAVAVHSLVKDLNLAAYGSTAMETNRSLPPEETVLLLRELLTIFDEKFDPLHMAKLSGLECGMVVATGENIWAHPSEIEARSSGIIPRVKHVNTSSSPADDSSGTSLPKLEPSAAVDPVASVRTEARLHILGVSNLRSIRVVGTQMPYCKWKLVDVSGHEIASDRTKTYTDGGRNPSWAEQPFLIPLTKASHTLKGCSLIFTVKASTAIRSIKETIGEGSWTFQSDDSREAGKDSVIKAAVMLVSKKKSAGSLQFQVA